MESAERNRRQMIICFGKAVAWITVSGAFVGSFSSGDSRQEMPDDRRRKRWSESHQLPNANAEVLPVPGTRPEFTPLESHFRMDNSIRPPSLREESWKLRVEGLVDHPMELTLNDIRKYDPTHQFVTLACITNPLGGPLMGTTRWTGVSMQKILETVHPLTKAKHLKFRSADGYYESMSVESAQRDSLVMLAYEWDGLPLSAEHGFPLRLYVPDLYGMRLPKWIVSISLMDRAEEGYWEERGWDAVAHVRATATIDVVGNNRKLTRANGQLVIPIGGIAYAGARGISKVQIQVDRGPWQNAQLRAPLSATTWVLWRFEWPFKSGRHTFTVRCFDGFGTQQITTEAPPNPSGATGLYRITANL
jgi:DMSO/TMAO reductase YedYZ molybdopterin-dependent catalytic subunit